MPQSRSNPKRLYQVNDYTQTPFVAEEVVSAYRDRQYLFIRNESREGTMRVGFGNWSSRNPLDGVLLAQGESFEWTAPNFVPNERLWVIGDRIGLYYSGWEG